MRSGEDLLRSDDLKIPLEVCVSTKNREKMKETNKIGPSSVRDRRESVASAAAGDEVEDLVDMIGYVVVNWSGNQAIWATSPETHQG